MAAGNFQAALARVLEHEGGFSDHPKDPGGATNLGVTLRTWREWVHRPVTVEELKKLTPATVAPLYEKKYWRIANCDSLPAGLDYLVFDFAVNAGPGRAVKTLQSALGVTADGVVGPKTLAAISAVGVEKTIELFTEERLKFYKSLHTFDVFGKGWTRRSEEASEAAKTMLA